MIITLTGENSFAIADTEQQYIRDFAQQHGAEGIERVEGETLVASRLPDLLHGMTLFAPARLVLLRNIAANKPIAEALPDLLASVADSITLIISDTKLDKRTRLYKQLKSSTDFRDYAIPSEAELARWIRETIEVQGGSITPADTQYLLRRVGADQWQLSSEIEKLVSYNTTIATASIDALVEPASVDGTAFDLLDAAFAGHRARTVGLVRQLATQEDPYKLFGLISSQVHALAVIATAGVGTTPDSIAKSAGVHPFVVRKLQSTAKRLSPQQLSTLVEDVALCDWQLKSSGASPWFLLE